jgi:effector-binding domain-containing protein
MNGFNMDEIRFGSTDYLLKRAVVKMSDISAFYATHLPEIGKLAAAKVKGAPSGIYWKWDEAGMQADMAAAMPVSDKNIGNETYSVVNIPDHKDFVIHYYGSYDNMMPAHQTLDSIIKMHGYTEPELVIEEYITDPMTQKDSSLWYTKIHYLVK